jgi:hypothetical protein
VEVWRDNERVAQGQLDVHMDSAASERPAREPRPHVQITITQIPRYDPAGGPDARADIGGRVSGDFSKGYSVILYARADPVTLIAPAVVNALAKLTGKRCRSLPLVTI